MIILLLFFVFLQACYASSMDTARNQGTSAALSATEVGKGAFAKENSSAFSSLKSWGISVNPNYQQSANPQELEEQASHKFQADETAQLIKKGHQTRELVQIDLDHIQIDGDGLIKNMGDGNLDGDETYEVKTCRTPGETFTSTCKRQRIMEVMVTPQISGSQLYCPGHAKKERQWHGHFKHWTDYCGGCAWRTVITQHKKVDILGEKWVGCEAEDKTHEEGLCELIEEVPGPYNQTHIFNGESITRDYWETTRVYKCGARVGNQ